MRSADIPVQAVKLSSAKTQLPYEYYTLPYCAVRRWLSRVLCRCDCSCVTLVSLCYFLFPCTISLSRPLSLSV